MESFKSILVDVDATVPAHPALERAIRLAQRAGATLTITDVMTVPAYARRYMPADIEEEMVSRRRQQLARLAHARRLAARRSRRCQAPTLPRRGLACAVSR